MNSHIELPDRKADEAAITEMQVRVISEMGIDPKQVQDFGVDQASELIRAYVIAYAYVKTLEASDDKRKGVLDPDEPIKSFSKYFKLPDRAKNEADATPTQARILRELQVQEDVCASLGVDQASILIRDVAIAAMEKRAIQTIRRAYDATKYG